MPLMTGMVMDRVWTELEAVEEGYTEVSRWFEPLIDTMKINTPNTHVVDDHTEALFCSIERERGIDTKHAVFAVWSTLFESRTTGVQQLHNNMSTIIMQAKMGTRPTTKHDFTTKWNTMPEYTQQSATALFERIKKYVGKGNIDMAPSSLIVTGMPAIVATGWDWRRRSAKKQLTREVLPSIQAIIMELEFAVTYRPEVLSDLLVWKLRSALSENMSTDQHQTKLKSTNTWSLAIRKKWKFWDRVIVPEPTVKMDMSNEEEIQKAQCETSRRIAAEKADRDAILKVQKLIASLPIAHVSPDKKSPIAIEVAKATNDLTNCISHTSSHLDWE
ncbi:hypothetical protein BDR07DRAFT_362178 [Suillus spraguei]|nr:hypothetical protein BDR07DRAFT_362178 [Suillus spraguei]